MKECKKIFIILIIFIGLFLLIIILINSKDKPKRKTIKKKVNSEKPHIQKEILTYNGIDSVLSTFQKIPYEKLDQDYRNYSGYEDEKYKANITGCIFYKIVGRDVLKNLVGKYTVDDFMPKDIYYYRNLKSINSNFTQYLCIDSDLLHKFLDLILALKDRGYDKYAFTINDGYRYPYFNDSIGGAPLSQHLYGKAIDLAIGDINKDGKYDEEIDKKIVLDLLENDIIKDKGGVGRYPGINAVHFDTRGFFARWDNN